jgi:hypothetical protein
MFKYTQIKISLTLNLSVKSILYPATTIPNFE